MSVEKTQDGSCIEGTWDFARLPAIDRQFSLMTSDRLKRHPQPPVDCYHRSQGSSRGLGGRLRHYRLAIVKNALILNELHVPVGQGILIRQRHDSTGFSASLIVPASPSLRPCLSDVHAESPVAAAPLRGV